MGILQGPQIMLPMVTVIFTAGSHANRLQYKTHKAPIKLQIFKAPRNGSVVECQRVASHFYTKTTVATLSLDSSHQFVGRKMQKQAAEEAERKD